MTVVLGNVYNSYNSAPTQESLTLEKLNECIRELRIQFPNEFKAAA